MEVSPDGEHFVLLSRAGLRILDRSFNPVKDLFTNNEISIDDLYDAIITWSPSGDSFQFYGHVFDSSTGEFLGKCGGLRVAISDKDTHTAATISHDQIFYVFDYKTQEIIYKFEHNPKRDTGQCVSISGDGSEVLASYEIHYKPHQSMIFKWERVRK